MPYINIKDGRREALRNLEPALTAGELNYQIFYYLKHNYYNIWPDELKHKIKEFVDIYLGEKPNYQKYNDITGALYRCAKEIERRLNLADSTLILMDVLNSYDKEINKYEDKKIEENGDVE